MTNLLSGNVFQKVLHLTNYALIYRRRMRCDRIQIAMFVETCPQECVIDKFVCDIVSY